MRIGMVGLASLYWPVCIGNGLIKKEGVDFVAAATLGEKKEYIKDVMGMLPEEYAEKYKIKLYTDADEMVKNEKLDAVVLGVSHTQHAHWAEQMAKLGMNVYIPKTFATTDADAKKMVELETKYGINIASGPSAKFLPVFDAAKKALDTDIIGKPFSIRVCHHHGVIDCFHKNDWYRNAEEGGPELSLAWYGIDLILGMYDQKPIKSVFASYGNYTTPDSPFMDCGRIEIRMEDGAMASFDMYFCNRVSYPSWQLEILGTKGVISIHRMPGKPGGVVLAADTSEGYRVLEIPETGIDWEMAWLDDFLAGRKHQISAAYSAYLTHISLAAKESAEKGCVVVP